MEKQVTDEKMIKKMPNKKVTMIKKMPAKQQEEIE
jgi:hypothetical protein